MGRRKRHWSEVMSCSCGATFTDMSKEAYHRHNFPALCKKRVTEEEARTRALAAAERVRLRHLIRQMAGGDLDGKIGTMDIEQLRNVVVGLGGEV